MRVLAVVELGSNWGHLLRLLPLVKALRARGDEVVMAVPDVELARSAFLGEDVRIEACPGAGRQDGQRYRTPVSHYAELLHRCAFGDEPLLEVALRDWAAFVARCKPDAMLTDFAPTALLVAHLHRLPLVQVAIGWEAPPAGEALPSVRPWETVDLAPMRQLEQEMLDRLNRICARENAPLLPRVAALYSTGTQLLATWPEADHFGPRAVANYIGPIFSADHGMQVSWPPRRVRDKHVLIYLAPDPRNMTIVDAMRRSPVHVIAILPTISAQLRRRLHGPRFQVFDQPVRLDALIRETDLVIYNGGHGLTAISMLAGVPMLALPKTMEQALAIERLTQTGAIRSIVSAGGPARAAHLAHEVLADGTSRNAAEVMARRYATMKQERTVAAVVNALTSCPGTDAGPRHAPPG